MQSLKTVDSARATPGVRPDRAALEALYDRYAALVRSICFDATGNDDTARDLCQEVFLRAFVRLPRLRDGTKAGSFLAGVARRVCREHGRRRGRERRKTRPLSEAPEPAADPSRLEGEDGRLLEALSELREDERLALHLFYLEDEPVESAREVIGLSRSGFYRLIERARERLRRRFARSTPTTEQERRGDET